MKKLLLSLSFVVASFIVTNAQEFKFGAGPVIGVPTGDAGTISSFVVGAEAQGEYSFNEKVSGIGSIGYNHFIGKDFDGFKINFGAVPILVGARYNASEKFFFGGQIGYGFFTGDLSSGGFAFRPQVGYKLEKLQLALSYSSISSNGVSINWLGLGAIFNIGNSGK